jgi:hypothetical protein
MRVVSSKSRRRSRHGPGRPSSRWIDVQDKGRLAVVAVVLSACSLDFDITGRQFECPPEVSGCLACNPDGTCREAAVIAPNEPGPVLPAPILPVLPVLPAPLPDAGSARDAGSPPLMPSPDAATPLPTGPTVPEECAEFESRASDSLCLRGSDLCFSLGSVLSPSLTAWLDPTTLPREGSRYWCDRSGKGHHALLRPDLLTPESGDVLVEPDGRAVGDDLARSVTLNGGWFSLNEGSEPVLRPGNFAVAIAAATPLEASDRQPFDLFESGDQSRITLSVAPGGEAVARISSLETSLVPDPVVTKSKVYDGRFHLYSLYRRSEVQILDDVLQLRLNAVLETRGSSIAIPRALDLAASRPPRIGGSIATGGVATGRGRVAAVVILRGSVPEDELARLENFLCEALAVCAAPGPPLSSEPPAPLDGGL